MKETGNYPSFMSQYDSLLFVFTYHPNEWSLTLCWLHPATGTSHMTWIWIFFSSSDAVRLFFHSFILLNPSVPVCYYFRGSVFTLIFSVCVSLREGRRERNCAVTHCRMQMYEDFLLFFFSQALFCSSLRVFKPPLSGTCGDECVLYHIHKKRTRDEQHTRIIIIIIVVIIMLSLLQFFFVLREG